MRTFDAPNGDDFTKAIRLTVAPRKRYPFRQDLTAVLFDEDYVQRAKWFEPLPLDYPHPDLPDVFLVDESPPVVRGDGLLRWTRTFATVPATRTEFESVNATFPGYKTTSATDANLRANFTQSVVGKVVYSYTLTSDPATDLILSPMFQPLDASGNACDFVASDTTPEKEAYEVDVAAGVYIQTDATSVERWKGNVWQLRNVYAKAL